MQESRPIFRVDCDVLSLKPALNREEPFVGQPCGVHRGERFRSADDRSGTARCEPESGRLLQSTRTASFVTTGAEVCFRTVSTLIDARTSPLLAASPEPLHLAGRSNPSHAASIRRVDV